MNQLIVLSSFSLSLSLEGYPFSDFVVFVSDGVPWKMNLWPALNNRAEKPVSPTTVDDAGCYAGQLQRALHDSSYLMYLIGASGTNMLLLK